MFDGLIRDHPSVPEYAARRGLALINMADVLRHLNRPDEAIQSLKRARVVVDALIGSHPDVPTYQSISADLALNFAALLNETGRRADAKSAYEYALSQHRRLQNRTEIDHFNEACMHGRLAILISAEPDGLTSGRRAEVAHHLSQAMEALFASAAAGFRVPSKFTTDPDLELLRTRPDFRLLLMDLVFPAKPFAG